MPEFDRIISVDANDIDNYGEVNVDVDITISEFLDGCYSGDIEEILLYIKRHFPELLKRYDVVESTHASESFYEEAVNKLHSNWNRLTKEQEDTIINIANTL